MSLLMLLTVISTITLKLMKEELQGIQGNKKPLFSTCTVEIWCKEKPPCIYIHVNTHVVIPTDHVMYCWRYYLCTYWRAQHQMIWLKCFGAMCAGYGCMHVTVCECCLLVLRELHHACMWMPACLWMLGGARQKSAVSLWSALCHWGEVICLAVLLCGIVLVCPIPSKHAVGILICLENY